MFLGQGILLQQLWQARDAAAPILPSYTGRAADSFVTYTEKLKRSFCSMANNLVVSGDGSEEERGADQPPSAIGSKRKRTSHDVFVPVEGPQERATAGAVDMCQQIPPSRELETILDMYFKYVHPWVPVLHAATFLRRVRDPNRPAGVSLLVQAIVAVASHFLHSPGDADSEEQQEQQQEARQYASLCRQNVITSAIESNTKESIQALILVTFDSMKRGLSASPWSLVAIISRKIDALQLYSEEPMRREGFSDYFSRPAPNLEAAHAWLEVEERRRVFWAAFLMDRFCSITSGAAPGIPSKNIRRRLPCDGYRWEQDLRVETSFFKTHEQGADETDAEEPEPPFPPAYADTEQPSGIGGLAYTIEASESLFLVTKFHARHPVELNKSSQLSSWLNKFRHLDSRLLQWELCLTHRWRDVRVVDGYIDPNLALAHMTHNAAIIVLHRRLAYPPASSRAWLSALVSAASREACVMAAIKMNRIANRYLDASDGIPPHQFVFCLYIAGELFLSQAAHQSIPPADEVGTIMAALDEISRRLHRGRHDAQQDTQDENPAAKFARRLGELRNDGSKQPSAEAWPAKTPMPAGGSFSDLQFMSPFGEMPTMLPQCAISPSSGMSWLGMAGLDGGGSPEFLGDNTLARTHSLLPNARMASNLARTPGGAAESPDGFDLMAELRKLEHRAREHDRRLIEGDATQQKKAHDS
ncbi:fungal specific transcription factor domain protein [Metarhizium robertsii]|uniref:Transcription factor, fungi n=2 Tax=Metarhizium robertsii TaxID=568076 RepID=E9FBF6_METRA|nr:uncharacterized protein MAA_09605 [Metarhizium robertsii ARSEF 23]EFY94894.1 Transcription factor, fungi [Metarhizium robertsii ARSEF 23]EXV01874.1 fungal specific transcription factor domain protein [Metarhizium robertsii]